MTKRETRTETLETVAAGTKTADGGSFSIDYSNISEGYVMASYSGTAAKAKVQITSPAGDTCTFTIFPNEGYAAFPLAGGSGDYTITLLELAYEDFYALLSSQALTADIQNEFSPFLYPNRYAWFTEGSGAVRLAAELSDESTDDIDFLSNVYHYVIRSVSYDYEKAETVPVDYVPDVDDTLAAGKGICFDYASLMTAMLRCQGIPTKLVVGYSGTAYHAWISVYLQETGWVDNVIEFDGIKWKLMDPTYAASNTPKAVSKYIGDGSHYTVKYSY